MLEGNCNSTIPIIRDMSRQHLIENNPHGINITLNGCFSNHVPALVINNAQTQHRVGLCVKTRFCKATAIPKSVTLHRHLSVKGHFEVSNHGEQFLMRMGQTHRQKDLSHDSNRFFIGQRSMLLDIAF